MRWGRGTGFSGRSLATSGLLCGPHPGGKDFAVYWLTITGDVPILQVGRLTEQRKWAHWLPFLFPYRLTGALGSLSPWPGQEGPRLLVALSGLPPPEVGRAARGQLGVDG